MFVTIKISSTFLVGSWLVKVTNSQIWSIIDVEILREIEKNKSR